MELDDFDIIYNNLLIEHGRESGAKFAKAVFDAGRNVSFKQNLKFAFNDKKLTTDMMLVAAVVMAKRALKVNAAELSICCEFNINNKDYITRLSSVTFEAEEKTLEERAGEIARNIMNSTVVSDHEELLKKAVLAGYNLRRDDFKEE